MDDVEAVLLWLGDQLPGWHVWCASGTGAVTWLAVPAPAGASISDIVRMSGRVAAGSPRQLLVTCKGRYGWHDRCDRCSIPSRLCGHLGREKA